MKKRGKYEYKLLIKTLFIHHHHSVSRMDFLGLCYHSRHDKTDTDIKMESLELRMICLTWTVHRQELIPAAVSSQRDHSQHCTRLLASKVRMVW